MGYDGQPENTLGTNGELIVGVEVRTEGRKNVWGEEGVTGWWKTETPHPPVEGKNNYFKFEKKILCRKRGGTFNNGKKREKNRDQIQTGGN